MQKSINHIIKELQTYQKIAKNHKLDVTVEINDHYNYHIGDYDERLIPLFSRIPNFAVLSDIVTSTGVPLIADSYTTGLHEDVDTLLRSKKIDKSYNLVGGTGLHNILAFDRTVEEAQLKAIKANIRFFPFIKEKNVYYRGDEVEHPILGDIMRRMYYIQKALPEICLEDITYRYVIDGYNSIMLCTPHTHISYNYLDAGRTLFSVPADEGNYSTIVIEELNFDSMLIMGMCNLDGSLVKELQDGCFVPKRNIKQLQLKLEKLLGKSYKDSYNEFKAICLKHFEKDAAGMILHKFLNGEIKQVEYNEVKFTADTATYETLSIEAPGLAKVVSESINMLGEFDIYQAVEAYTKKIEASFDKPYNTIPEVERTFTFSINKIPLTVSIVASDRRQINGINIRKDELAKVLNRATCYTDAAKFSTFIQSVNQMSLLYHDTLANGLKVVMRPPKDNKPIEKDHTFPKLSFKKEGRKYFVQCGEDEKKEKLYYRITDFGAFIRKIKSLNAHTEKNAAYYRDGRQYARCEDNLKILLNEYSVKLDGQALTDAEIQKIGILEHVYAERDAAVKRSIELLNKVVEKTGAELTKYKDMTGYLVKGKLNEYFVDKFTNKVYNYKTGRYICIVNHSHDRDMGVGFDELVARILALKNDSKMTTRITTLRAAQEDTLRAENAEAAVVAAI